MIDDSRNMSSSLDVTCRTWSQVTDWMGVERSMKAENEFSSTDSIGGAGDCMPSSVRGIFTGSPDGC